MRLEENPQLPTQPDTPYARDLNYTLARVFRNIASKVNGLADGRIVANDNALDAAPSFGTWNKGDIVRNTLPSGATPVWGWICTAEGTPGTWVALTAGGGGGGGGGGDFSGPASSVNNNIVTFNGTTGKLGKDSGVGIASLATTASVTAVTAKTKYTRGATWSGGGSAVVAAGSDVVSVNINVPGTITGAMILTKGGPGSCQIDVWKAAYASYPPTIANTITAAALPTVTAGIKSYDTTLTGWTTAVAAGDVVSFVLNSSSTFTLVQIFLEITP